MSSGQKIPHARKITKVTIESEDGVWVLKKKASIAEWCKNFQKETAVKPVAKKAPTKKKVRFSKPIKKVKQISSSSSAEISVASDSDSSSSEGPKIKGGYAKLNLDYRVEEDDPIKAGQKMASKMKGRFSKN